MLLGPVFAAELTTTSRRPRLYLMRFLYGGVLFLLLWQTFQNLSGLRNGFLTPIQIRSLARSVFVSIVIFQGIVVYTLVPSLCAGVIANEKQRKTLHYLLTSHLTSAEIVIGKLAARMLHVVVFLAIGLPVLVLLSLLGGVDPLEGLLATSATLCSAFFLACLSLLCSTLAKRVREAITATYGLEALWLFTPIILRTAALSYSTDLYTFLRPLNELILDSTPMRPLEHLMMGRGGTGAILESIFWMMGLQVVAGIVCLFLAIYRLRPTFRVQEDRGSVGLFGINFARKYPRLRLFSRRPVSDNPILWKEMNTTRGSLSKQIFRILVGVMAVSAVTYWTWLFAVDAFHERAEIPTDQTAWNLWNTLGPYGHRAEFNLYIRWITTAISMLTILGTAITSANCITSELEDDTWISLISTPLGGREIVSAKLIGTLWRTRWSFAFLTLEWLLGIVCGSVHILGAIFQFIALCAFVWFAAALGTCVSLASKSTWKSQSTTTAILSLLGGGYLAFCCPVFFGGDYSYLYFSACIPFILFLTPISQLEFAAILQRGGKEYLESFTSARSMAAACAIGSVAYTVLAAILTIVAFSLFDRAVDRPRRSAEPDTPTPYVPPLSPD